MERESDHQEVERPDQGADRPRSLAEERPRQPDGAREDEPQAEVDPDDDE
jgi:hypothetical protein